MPGESVARKIRVLYVVTTLKVGGAEGQAARLAARLNPERFEVAVFCLGEAGANRSILDAAGIPILVVGFHGFGAIFRNPRQVLGPLASLFRSIDEFRPDIVHGFLFWAYVIGAFIARAARVRYVVASRRSLGCFKAGKRNYLLLERLANRLTDSIVANSEAVRRDAIAQEHLRPEKVQVIYNGIDEEYLRPRSSSDLAQSLHLVDSRPRVCVLANFHVYKGHRYFLAAWQVVLQSIPFAVALLIGDGPIRSELEEQARSMGISRSVRFLGSRHDVAELLSLMDLVVHPSLEEGFPNAILEAMAAGKAVVATAVGGNPEAIVDGVTGLLVPPADAESLASAMLRLLKNPAESAVLGEAGRQRAMTNFGMRTMVTAYEQLYERLMSKNHSGFFQGPDTQKLAVREEP